MRSKRISAAGLPDRQSMKRGNAYRSEMMSRLAARRRKLAAEEAYRLKLNRKLASTGIGKTYTMMFLLLSAVSCAVFIFETYLTQRTHEDRLRTFRKVDLALVALFAFDWGLNLFLSSYRVAYTFRYVLISFYYFCDDLLMQI